MNPDAEPAVAKELSYRGAAARVIAGLWIAAIVYTVAVMPFAARTSGRTLAAGPIVEQIILLLLWGAATPAILLSAERLPLDRRHWLRNGIAHGVLATVFIVTINVIAPALTWIVLRRPFDIAVILRHGMTALLGAFHLALIVYAFILGAGHYLHTLDVRRRELLRAERLRADLAAAQLRALTLQLQPHFLFNALNAVGALIVTERNREAFEVVGRLGELLRALLAVEHREEVTLREELELAEAYLAIEQARLGERLRVSWEVDDGVRSAHVPPMLLQPLAENAIRHGVNRVPAGGQVVIAATKSGDRLVLEVRDDGAGPAAPSTEGTWAGGVGLANTRQRLSHLYGDEHRLALERTDGWTRVHVELPYRVLSSVPGPRDPEVAA